MCRSRPRRSACQVGRPLIRSRRAPVRHESEAGYRAYLIADIASAENAGWDRALLVLSCNTFRARNRFRVLRCRFDRPEIDILIGDLSLGLND